MERTEDTLYPDSREALSTQTFNQHGWAALIYRVKKKLKKKFFARVGDYKKKNVCNNDGGVLPFHSFTERKT